MKLLRGVSLAAVVLATALGTVCASMTTSTGPHFAWRVVGPNITNKYNSGVAYGADNVFVGYCTTAGIGFAAYDALTGAMRWNNTNLLDQYYGCYYPPLYHGDTVYAIGSYSAVAFDASTGAVLWTQTNNLNNANGVIVFDSLNGNIVFIGNGYHFVVSALDASTGAIRWQHMLNDWQSAENPASIAVGYNHVYVPHPNGTVAALRADTGAFDWAVTVTTEGEIGPVATVCGVLLVSESSGNYVYGLDAATGATQWMVLIETNWQAPVVDEDSCTAYYTTLNGAAAIAVLSGTATWEVTNGNASYSMAAVAGGRFWEVSYQNEQQVPAAVVVRNATTGTVTGTLPLNVRTATGDASRVTATSTDGSMFFFALSDLTLYGVSADAAPVRAATERHCAGFACTTNCTTVDAPLGCVALPAGDGSVLRRCSAGGAALEVSVFPGSSTCDGGAAPPQTTSYGVGTCYPDNVGGSFVVEACPA